MGKTEDHVRRPLLSPGSGGGSGAAAGGGGVAGDGGGGGAAGGGGVGTDGSSRRVRMDETVLIHGYNDDTRRTSLATDSQDVVIDKQYGFTATPHVTSRSTRAVFWLLGASAGARCV